MKKKLSCFTLVAYIIRLYLFDAIFQFTSVSSLPVFQYWNPISGVACLSCEDTAQKTSRKYLGNSHVRLYPTFSRSPHTVIQYMELRNSPQVPCTKKRSLVCPLPWGHTETSRLACHLLTESSSSNQLFAAASASRRENAMETFFNSVSYNNLKSKFY